MEPADPQERPTGPSADDLRRLSEYAAALADGIDQALGPWVERSVERLHVERLTRRPPQEVREAAVRAGVEATAVVGGRVRALLMLDIDDQRTGPLALLRMAATYPTRVLLDAGVPTTTRDEFLRSQFPEDLYDLGPASFADIDPALHEPGLIWGAAKAHVHLARRRAAAR
jgi:hypothetical protein